MTTNGIALSRRSLFRSGAALIGTAAIGRLAVLPAAADTLSVAEPSPHGAGYYRFNVGEIRATVISEGYGPFPFWPTFAANVTQSDVDPVLAANYLKPENQVTNNILVLDTVHGRILVDTGFGEVLGPNFGHFSDLSANLGRAGITPESIDIVLLTHGHIDHVGGIVGANGELVFPKATYAMAQKEWAYWTGSMFESEVSGSNMPDALKQGTIWAAKTNLTPIAKMIALLPEDGEVVPGVHLIPAPGHSPFHSAVLVESGSEQLIHWADVAHNPVTGPQQPEWTSIFDYDGIQTVKTRKAMLDRVSNDRTLVMGFHFPFPAIGHIERAGNAFRFIGSEWNW